MAPPSKASLWKAKVYAHALSEGIARLTHQRSAPIDDCVRLDLDQLRRIDETRDLNHRACRADLAKDRAAARQLLGSGQRRQKTHRDGDRRFGAVALDINDRVDE